MAEETAWSKQKIKSRIEENELDLSLCGISKVPLQNMVLISCFTFKNMSLTFKLKCPKGLQTTIKNILNDNGMYLAS